MNILKIREIVGVAYRIINQIKGFIEYLFSETDIAFTEKFKNTLNTIKDGLDVIQKVIVIVAKLLKVDLEEEISVLGVESFDPDTLKELTEKFKGLVE